MLTAIDVVSATVGTRVLRQHYEGVAVDVAPELGDTIEPWLRHRHRFRDALVALPEAEWQADTRCTEWNVSDVVAHIVTADQFWIMTLTSARAGAPATTFLRGFDPSSSLEPVIAPLRTLPPADVLAQFVANTETFMALVDQFGAADWEGIGESPFGHIPARFIFTHAFWDSWLHERDIFKALGDEPPVETDELLAATWFSFFVAGIQGGLLADSDPVGPGLEHPVDVTLRFDDLPSVPLPLAFADDVRIDVGTGGIGAGRAVDLVEGFAGRCPAPTLPDAELAAHCARAAQIL
jgi:uncharacterized protein (TIGR03083 family)